jgi:hypothetical protein
VIIQDRSQKKKEFKAFEMSKVKRFKALNSPEAWLALLKLSTVDRQQPPETNSL